jgi:hypothetical protein
MTHSRSWLARRILARKRATSHTGARTSGERFRAYSARRSAAVSGVG